MTFCVNIIKRKIDVTIIKKYIEILICDSGMIILLIVSEPPRTKRIFIIFDPKIFPITKPVSPLFNAITDVTSSGRLVPNATSDTEITIFGTLKIEAILMADPINISEPYPNAIIPININAIHFILIVSCDMSSGKGTSSYLF